MAPFNFESINQCAIAAKSGDPVATDRLMELSYPWVKWIIRQKGWFLPSGGDGEDMLQEGMIGVFEALEDWNPQASAFTSFGQLCVERQLITVVKTQTREKRKAQNEAMSLNQPAMRDKHGHEGDGEERLGRWDLPDTSGLGVDPAVVVAGNEADILLETMQTGLSALEREMMNHCLLQNQTYEEAAAAIGVGAKSADNALQRVRRKIARQAAELATSEHFTEDTRALLGRTAELAAQPRKQVSDEELRANLPIELLRPPGLNRFGSQHLAWIVPADRLLAEYPDIHSYAVGDAKRAVLDAYLRRLSWKEIAVATGCTVSSCKHHLRRMCEKAAKTKGITHTLVRTAPLLLQRIEQLWTKGLKIAEITQALSHVATPEQVRLHLGRLYNRKARRRLAQVPDSVQTRRIPLVRLNRIPHLLRKAKPLLIPEYQETLKLYMQGYSHREIAERRRVALNCIGKNDLPVIRRALKETPGFEWLCDARVRERQVRHLALDALGVTVEQALERIPTQHQETYRLYLEGWSHQEIDHQLGLRPGATEKNLHYSRSCIRRQDFRSHTRRHNTPERDAARRIQLDPEMHRRYMGFGHLLEPDRRRLLEEYFKGTSMGAITVMFGAPENNTGRSRMYARIQRASAILKKLEEAKFGGVVPAHQTEAGD